MNSYEPAASDKVRARRFGGLADNLDGYSGNGGTGRICHAAVHAAKVLRSGIRAKKEKSDEQQCSSPKPRR